MTPDERTDRLPCGVDLDVILEQVTEAAPADDPAHQQSCPHCRAALDEVSAIWAPVRELAEQQVQAPRQLMTDVMAQVRELLRDGWHAVLATPLGTTRIATWVIASIARREAQRVPAVLAVIGRAGPVNAAAGLVELSAGGPDPQRRAQAGGVGIAGRRVVVNLDLVVELGPDLRVVAEQVRRAVVRSVGAVTGLRVIEVDIQIVDVVDPND